MPALTLWWAYIRTGSIGAWTVTLVKDWSEMSQHHVQTPIPRCTKAKASRSVQHLSLFGSAGNEGAASAAV